MNEPATGDSLLRFDLAVQRNRFLVYTLAFLTSIIGRFLGVFPPHLAYAIFVLLSSCSIAVILYWAFARGVNRNFLNPVWMTADVILVTIGVFATGGLDSLWYIWYAAVGSAAAFAAGKRAALLVWFGGFVAYVGTLVAMGQARFFDASLYLAIGRMIFLFGASYFFLVGVANLQEKRLRVRQLEAEESRKVAELTRLTEELASANERTMQADKLKSQFLANMSHELRTPMNSIIGFSEILVERLEGRIEPKHLSFLKHIHASGQHLLGIINDILDLSKIEAGKMEIYPEFFSIPPVIESVCHVMKGMTKTQPNFVLDVQDDLPQIETDLAKFKQVLFNLLSNAVKFSPPEAPIAISVWYARDEVTISVRDEGIGIDPKYHRMIFEEFRQVDGTPKREFGGTGLGLALVKKFVELQGGHVQVESSPDMGSTFSVVLPVRTRAAVVSRAIESPSMTNAAGDRVLVVEDDANAYDLISSALGSAGYSSVRARHGEEAIRIARELRPVAVTLDLVLPGLDGWEVLKRLKTDPDTADLPVVIISMMDNRELGVALGADDYFVKPVDRERLLERLRQITQLSGHATRPRLLLIDDDAAVHALLDEELTSLGYAVSSAFTGEEGLRCAVEVKPDVIILDLMMPGMSGFEVADGLKDDARTANIPILILTSKELSGEDRLELQSKVASFVQKGKSARDQLVREIRRLSTVGARV